MLASIVCGQYYFIPESNSKLLEEEQLKGKSNTFFRYARNEIFARHGYKFKNVELNTFFGNMDWYNPNSNIEMHLNDFEKYNVELLKSLEVSTEYGDFEVLYKYDFNGYPLYYIGMEKNDKKTSIKWESGEFILLEKKNNWLLSLNEIPPEYLIKNASTEPIIINDFMTCLKMEQIKIEDFDFGYKGNVGDEIIVKLFGPSDDFELIYLGLNNDNKLSKLIYIPSNNITKSKINESKILVKVNVREDLHGTSSFNQEYIYDTIEKELYQVPNLFMNLGWDCQYKSIKEIPVFYDARSAALKSKLGQIDLIPTDTKVNFLKFYRVESEGSVQIKYKKNNKEIEGWIAQGFSNSYYFSGMPAAD